MKLTIVIIICCIFYSSAQVGIGTTNPHKSSILELKSTNKGFLPPRLTENQRDSISNPAIGLMIYNTTRKCIEIYKGNKFHNLCCPSVIKNGIDSLPFLYRLNAANANSVIKINGTNGTSTGTQANINDFVYNFIGSDADGNDFNHIYDPGNFEVSNFGHNVFQLVKEPSFLSYQNKTFVKRLYSVKNTGGQKISNLSYDFTSPYNSQFEIFLVGRMDPTPANPITDFACFFSSSDDPKDIGSIQIGVGNGNFGNRGNGLGNCSKEYYTVTYRLSPTQHRVLCGKTNADRVSSEDGDLHVFNLRSENHPTIANQFVLSLFIDNVLVDVDSNLSTGILFENFKLFSNRKSDNGSPASISELIFFTQPLIDQETSTGIGEYLNCNYGD